jgi:hypothetical protein
MDLVRRALAALLVATGLVALLPVLPMVFGYYSATVLNDSSSTYHSQTTAAPSNLTQFIYCEMTPNTVSFRKNSTISGTYFRCYNNWGTDINVTLQVVDANGLGLGITAGSFAITAGTSSCLNVDITSGSTSGNDLKVVWGATATASDLTAQLQFPATVTVKNGAGNTAANCV